MEFPLAGLRVLDLSRVVSGPYATRMMADLGADVVKVEPPSGDIARFWGEVRNGLSGFYTQQNAGKRNICIDLDAAGAARLIFRLAMEADVLVENFRPGVMARHGLAWETVSSSNPGLVMLSITGFGQSGPQSERQTYASVIHAESGLLARQAGIDRRPATDPMLSIADADAGLHGLVAVLAALVLRARTGQGQWIDMAMLDAMLATDDYAHHALDGSPVHRLGGEVWDAAGGPVLISSEPKYLWHQVSSVHGVADPTPPGAGLADKIACRRRAVAAWLTSFTDRSALTTALEEANLAWADVPSQAEALSTPRAQARGVVATVDDGGGGLRRVVQSPYRFSAALSGVRAGAPHRGEHNSAVLADWLGMTAPETEVLVRDGILQAEPGRPRR
ncbi:MAG: CaiB/BaiF CoA transferase family protein [Acidimicrobiales bacterium]